MKLNQTDQETIEMMVKQRNIMKRIIYKQNKIIEDLSLYLPERARKSNLENARGIQMELNKLDSLLRGDAQTRDATR